MRAFTPFELKTAAGMLPPLFALSLLPMRAEPCLSLREEAQIRKAVIQPDTSLLPLKSCTCAEPQKWFTSLYAPCAIQRFTISQRAAHQSFSGMMRYFVALLRPLAAQAPAARFHAFRRRKCGAFTFQHRSFRPLRLPHPYRLSIMRTMMMAAMAKPMMRIVRRSVLTWSSVRKPV